MDSTDYMHYDPGSMHGQSEAGPRRLGSGNQERHWSCPLHPVFIRPWSLDWPSKDMFGVILFKFSLHLFYAN